MTPKFISPADPAARWTGAHGGQAFFGYSTNYLIDLDNAIIVDLEATTAIRQAEVLAAKHMIERSMQRFDLYPAKLMGDSAYGSAEMLGWLVYEHGIEPHVTVFDKSTRQDGTFSRDDFTYDHAGDVYYCPGGKMLTTTSSPVNDGATLRYRASKYDCQACRLKTRCCPKEPARYVPRSIYEGARDMARGIAKSWQGRVSRRLRKKIEMLFAHLKRILKLDRLRLRGPNGARDEFLLAATVQNLRKLAKPDTGTEPKACPSWTTKHSTGHGSGKRRATSQHLRLRGTPLRLRSRGRFRPSRTRAAGCGAQALRCFLQPGIVLSSGRGVGGIRQRGA